MRDACGSSFSFSFLLATENENFPSQSKFFFFFSACHCLYCTKYYIVFLGAVTTSVKFYTRLANNFSFFFFRNFISNAAVKSPRRTAALRASHLYTHKKLLKLYNANARDVAKARGERDVQQQHCCAAAGCHRYIGSSTFVSLVTHYNIGTLLMAFHTTLYRPEREREGGIK